MTKKAFLFQASLVGVLMMGGVVACTTTPPAPPAVSVLEVTGKTCSLVPSLTGSVTLIPKRKAATNNVVSDVGSANACLTKDGKSSNYVVFELPTSPENHTLTVGGMKEGLRAFAPKVSVLDGSGGVLRAFEKDRLTNFGTTFSVQFRPPSGARYLLVQSDPELVGTVMATFETNIVSNTNYAYNPYGYGGTYTTQSGSEGARTRSFSHEGKVVVYIQAVTGKIGLPDDK
jgi:hypothetical protein